ncbi:MAG: hypothetical protein Q8L68_05575 [Methylococcales bacterium]|nr:hypothetical protein [Methylococcales bacterium]
MEGIFSLSFTELIVLAFLAFLLLKPDEYVKIRKWGGQMLNKLVSTQFWKEYQVRLRELSQLPSQLIREAREDLNKDTSENSPTE